MVKRISQSMRPVLWIVVLLVFCLISFALVSNFHTSSARPAGTAFESIPSLKSTVDKDADGIDDQTDILNGALDYVRTEPTYKSAYYATGYPDDGYGVCTDVIAFALRGAGYDLQQLVQEDITKNGADYAIATPDANIDFRRVSNLHVYFSHTAISLTTDVNDIEAWQGGDIVVFQDHIGIVSDRRNAHGIPFVIHHSGPMQLRYEEDILTNRKDLVAHYRISE